MMTGTHWLRAMRAYLAVSAGANLGWEFGHLPLYTIWQTGSGRDIAVASLHCTVGDVLIAAASLVVALIAIGRPDWPAEGFTKVAILTIGLGAGYTVYSERLNTAVRKSWEYSELMPVVPLIDVGLSPILQWIVIPPVALIVARHRAARPVSANLR